MNRLTVALIGVLLSSLAARAWAGPPAQKLPSAFVVLPLIESSNGTRDTRIELVNLTENTINVQCFYVYGDDTCNEIGFFLTMTPFQPVSWLATRGFSDVSTFSRVPPFYGEGELKCVVLPERPEVAFHNALQARAIVYGSDGQTIAYSATAFRRLTDGDYTGQIPLDGVTYEQCPYELHFHVLAEQAGASESEMVLVPCTEDLLTQTPTQPNVQYSVINEFEQAFSASIKFKCFDRRKLTDISNTLASSTLGSDTAHVVVRGSSFALIGLGIDHFTFNASPRTAANDPSFQGGRSATVNLP